MAQLHELLPQLKGDIMPQYEDEFMMSVVTQLKYLQTQDAHSETLVPKVYRNILTVMDSVSVVTANYQTGFVNLYWVRLFNIYHNSCKIINVVFMYLTWVHLYIFEIRLLNN